MRTIPTMNATLTAPFLPNGGRNNRGARNGIACSIFASRVDSEPERRTAKPRSFIQTWKRISFLKLARRAAQMTTHRNRYVLIMMTGRLMRLPSRIDMNTIMAAIPANTTSIARLALRPIPSGVSPNRTTYRWSYHSPHSGQVPSGGRPSSEYPHSGQTVSASGSRSTRGWSVTYGISWHASVAWRPGHALAALAACARAGRPSHGLLPRQLLPDELVCLGRVHVLAVLFHEGAHRLADLLLGERVLRQELLHQSRRVVGRGLLRQVLLDDRDLALDLLDLGGFPVLFVLLGALAQLLRVARNRLLRRGLAGHQVHVLHVAEQHADHAQAVLLAGLHRGLHVLGQAGLQVHRGCSVGGAVGHPLLPGGFADMMSSLPAGRSDRTDRSDRSEVSNTVASVCRLSSLPRGERGPRWVWIVHRESR